ncbi:MAG: YkgJ family cysteine cluster protein [Candidatus Desulforudis sp.]|nr:YkgJ family cysteine cluster protein [Desulforudis sp.]
MYNDLFAAYEQLAAGADEAFQAVERDYGDQVRCRLYCDDCCYAVFGLFLIESVYLKHHFDQLDSEKKQEALARANKADKALAVLEKGMADHQDDPELQAYTLGRERIRCPLLNDRQECILYPFRPITCRIYGVPTKIQGRAFVCGQTGFQKGEPYPAFDLDAVYKNLYRLSVELLEKAGRAPTERASLLVAVSKSIKTDVADLIAENL